VDDIDNARLIRGGSGLAVHSDEYKITDLDESEFELLLTDFDSDPDFQPLQLGLMSDTDAIGRLEGRC